MENKIEPIELQEFIKTTLEQIESGAEIGKRSFRDTVDFEVSVNKTQKIGGGVKIYVASGEGELNKEHVAKIKFSVFPHNPNSRRNHLYKIPTPNYN